jgi:hypothetical protein
MLLMLIIRSLRLQQARWREYHSREVLERVQKGQSLFGLSFHCFLHTARTCEQDMTGHVPYQEYVDVLVRLIKVSRQPPDGELMDLFCLQC